jgi:hypothetical protein
VVACHFFFFFVVFFLYAVSHFLFFPSHFTASSGVKILDEVRLRVFTAPAYSLFFFLQRQNHQAVTS